MYKRILLALDNSDHSRFALDAAIRLARACSSMLVGTHVYAARLHDSRFGQMEPGLPPAYQEGEQLDILRKTHNSLIGLGLGLISESYLDVFSERCREAGIVAERKMREGRNHVELVDELATGGFDLVALGAFGLGRVSSSVIGSVCERVARAARCDVLVARGTSCQPSRGFLVGIDGSDDSFNALHRALELADKLGGNVEAVAVYDPSFHTAAFRGIEKVLSREAGKIFNFAQQEMLHNQIIDEGLAKLYAGHLRRAGDIAADRGVELETSLLTGKPFEALVERARQKEPTMLLAGRFGFHRDGTLDMGSNAENLMRLAPCDVLICGQESYATEDRCRLHVEENTSAKLLIWTAEAEARLQLVPSFARPMARKGIENYAREHGFGEITVEVFDAARRSFGM